MMPSSFPLIYRWGSGPDCQSLKHCCLTVENEPVVTAPPWRETGPADKPFDFCTSMTALIGAIASGCDELGHIQAERLLIGVSVARSRTRYGLQARVTPLRFPDGSVHVRRRGKTFQVQRHFLNGVEMLYHVTFCLPRFLDQSFDEKMVTIFHELYHIHPRFNGDLRRHQGRCHAHTESKSMYDAHMAALARLWLATRPDPALTSFLRLDFAQLAYKHNGILGAVLPRPRLVPLPVAS